jgi:hypothetical protein
VQYTLPSRVGCSVMSVIHNWFGPVRGELAVNQILGDLIRFGAAPSRPAHGTGKARTAHQQFNRATPDDDAAGEPQFDAGP